MTDGDSQPLVGAHSGLPLAVYEQLKAIARVRMAGERTGHTLQTTALVHEAYMRLTRAGTLEGNDRPRFFRAAAEAMRHVLIDHARAKGRVLTVALRRQYHFSRTESHRGSSSRWHATSSPKDISVSWSKMRCGSQN